MMWNALTDQSLQHWRHKLVLLLVLWLITPASKAPSAPNDALKITSSVPSTPSGVPLDPSNPERLLSLRSFTSVRAIGEGGNARGAEAVLTLGVAGAAEEGKKTAEASAKSSEPAPHSKLLRKQTQQPKLGQLTSGVYSTPPLSPPPPAPSLAPRAATAPLADGPAQADPKQRAASLDADSPLEQPTLTTEAECEVDERGRPRCPGTTRLPLSLSDRRNELADAVHEFGQWFVALLRSTFYEDFSLSPFTIILVLFHLLLAVQVAAMSLEDAIIRTDIGAPAISEFPRGGTLAKRLNRIRWKAAKALKRHAGAIMALAMLLGVTGWVAHECWGKGQGRAGWNDAPFARWLLKPLEEGQHCTTKCKRSPFRELVLLECVATLVALLQPIKHLVPSSILPPTLPAPRALLAPTTPAGASKQEEHPDTRLDSLWLVDHALLAIAALVSILQALALVLLLPSYSPLSLPPHLLFHHMRARGQELAALRGEVRRTVDCLETVLKLFPAAGQETGTSSGNEDEFLCTICFEGQGDSTGKTADRPCRLGCGHQFHAGCISKWLHRQSWCPCCHMPLHAPSQVEVPPILLPPEPERDESDLYPGMTRRRAQGSVANAG